jgi:hypothetical protein
MLEYWSNGALKGARDSKMQHSITPPLHELGQARELSSK